MPGVRHGWRDARVASGCRDAFARKRRVVISVDEEVRHAWVPWVLLVQLLQNGRRFELVGVGRVARLCGRLKRKCIEHLSLIVVWVALGQLLHRVVVGQQSGVEGNLVVVLVVGAQRFDPIALAFCLRADRARFLRALPKPSVHLCARAVRPKSCPADPPRSPSKLSRSGDLVAGPPQTSCAHKGTNRNAAWPRRARTGFAPWDRRKLGNSPCRACRLADSTLLSSASW